MNNPDNVRTDKKPYQKPRIERVKLVPEEAVLTSCKVPHGTIIGPNNANCRGGGGPICFVHAS